MITVTVRPLTKKELELLKRKRPWLINLIEEYFLLFIVIYIALLIPLLLIDKLFLIPSYLQLIYCILIILLTVYVIRIIRRKYGNRGYRTTDNQSELAEIIYVKTDRAIEREDIEDFGSSFYLDVEQNGETRTLFLWGQYLDELGEGKFPNSEFILTRKAGSKELIEFKLLGKYFKPEKVLPAFDKKLWRSGSCHEDGQIINTPIDEIS